MSPQVLIRYPSGQIEFRLSSERAPAVGEALSRNGQQWEVTDVQSTELGTVVIVALKEEDG